MRGGTGTTISLKGNVALPNEGFLWTPSAEESARLHVSGTAWEDLTMQVMAAVDMMRIFGRTGMTPPDAAIRPYLNPSPWVQPPNLNDYFPHTSPELR